MAVKNGLHDNDPPPYSIAIDEDDADEETQLMQQERPEASSSSFPTPENRRRNIGHINLPRPSPHISFCRTNDPIQGHLVLDLSNLNENPSNGYDAYFKNQNSFVKITLETTGTPKISRPIKIFAESKNSSARLILNSNHCGPWDIEVNSSNGPAYLFFPDKYSGELKLVTKNGGISIQPNLLPNVEPRTQSLFIVHSSTNWGNDTGSKALVKSQNGTVTAGLSGTPDVEAKSCCDCDCDCSCTSCCIIS